MNRSVRKLDPGRGKTGQTSHFTILEPQCPWIDEFYVVQADLKAHIVKWLAGGPSFYGALGRRF